MTGCIVPKILDLCPHPAPWGILRQEVTLPGCCWKPFISPDLRAYCRLAWPWLCLLPGVLSYATHHPSSWWHCRFPMILLETEWPWPLCLKVTMTLRPFPPWQYSGSMSLEPMIIPQNDKDVHPPTKYVLGKNSIQIISYHTQFVLRLI